MYRESSKQAKLAFDYLRIMMKMELSDSTQQDAVERYGVGTLIYNPGECCCSAWT